MKPDRFFKIKHVVVLVLDAFRYQYFTEVPDEYIPNLRNLVKEGVFYTNFWSVFPSSTYPAHAALLSGCMPGIMRIFNSHGGSYDSPLDSIMDAAQRQGLLIINLIGYEIKVYEPGGVTNKILKSWERPKGIYVKGFEGNQIRIIGQRKHAEEIMWTIEHVNPDILYCRLPATDWAGHANGALDAPDEECKEAMLEVIKETDGLTNEIIKTLDRTWGRENYVMFITADHGTSYAPNNVYSSEIENFLSERGVPVKVVEDNVALIYLQDKKKHLEKAISLLDSSKTRTLFHIDEIYWGKQHMEKIYGHVNESDMDECPDILLQPFQEYRYVAAPSSLLGSHNTLKETDMRIPLVCFGPGIRKETSINDKRTIIDITPTVSYLLGIEPPKYSQGQVLEEIFENSFKKLLKM